MNDIIADSGIRNGKKFVTLKNTGNFSVFKTFDCGQCFRFNPVGDNVAEGDCTVSGVAYGREITVSQRDGITEIVGADDGDYRELWERYLSLDTDYDAIDRAVVSSLDERGNAVMKRAAEMSAGIRILRQEPWEALCSFIVSQNNNIPRIKKIINAMCIEYGEKIGDGTYSFPTARALADAGEEKIFALRTGFRAKYIADAAEKVADGEIDLDSLLGCEDYEKCEKTLMSIKGVGPKVAACALLFGFGKTEAYPVDIWMKKVAAKYFDNGPDPKKFGKYAGIAQQYLFYMERYLGGNSPEK